MAVLPIAAETGWDKAQQGLVLSAFFWGYTATQLFGGTLNAKFGSKLVAGLSLAGGCPFVIFFPFTVQSLPLAMAAQISCGVCHSVLYPSFYGLLANWFPTSEKSRAVAVMNSGGIMGMVISWALSPYLISYLGWRSLFYIAGGSGLFWLIPWLCFTIERPTDPSFCLTVSEQEIDTISRGRVVLTPVVSIPWKAMLTSWPVIVLAINQFACNWVFYIWMSWLPSYYSSHFDITLEQVGLFSSIPMVVYLLVLLGAGMAADMLYKREVWTRMTIRKVFQSLTFGIIIAASCVLSFVPLNLAWTILMIVFSLASVGFSTGGVSVNVLDLSEKYVTSLVAFVNTCGSLPGILGVFVTGYILETTNNNWVAVFMLTAAICGVSLILWLLYVRVETIEFDKRNSFEVIGDEDNISNLYNQQQQEVEEEMAAIV
eukprot:TRINITY_DN2489_c0_g1_i2.p1 TRINITY_DN2489_c0_g1~~TRINITY_DN2489_c0_g1_i2.p1  ORF type:complete len:486 (+),score=78.80 TRINITY_DN2489_c0_g1_i2:174-1460(+)